MADNDNVVPLFRRDPDWLATAHMLEDCNIPITRENYLAVAYAGEPPEWCAEIDDDLPPFLRDDSRTFKPKPRHGFYSLTPEEWAEMEKTT
jgi:hypothetical protein